MSSGGRDNPNCPTPVQFLEGRANHPKPNAEARGGLLSTSGGHAECRCPRGAKVCSPLLLVWELGGSREPNSHSPVVHRLPMSGEGLWLLSPSRVSPSPRDSGSECSEVKGGAEGPRPGGTSEAMVLGTWVQRG